MNKLLLLFPAIVAINNLCATQQPNLSNDFWEQRKQDFESKKPMNQNEHSSLTKVHSNGDIVTLQKLRQKDQKVIQKFENGLEKIGEGMDRNLQIIREFNADSKKYRQENKKKWDEYLINYDKKEKEYEHACKLKEEESAKKNILMQSHKETLIATGIIAVMGVITQVAWWSASWFYRKK